MFTLDQRVAEHEGEPSSNGVSAEPEQVQPTVDVPASDSAALPKLSLEDKRKAIQAERLRKQQEMEALLAQEEALLRAAEEGRHLLYSVAALLLLG